MGVKCSCGWQYWAGRVITDEEESELMLEHHSNAFGITSFMVGSNDEALIRLVVGREHVMTPIETIFEAFDNDAEDKVGAM